jgi:hypothetical protein
MTFTTASRWAFTIYEELPQALPVGIRLGLFCSLALLLVQFSVSKRPRQWNFGTGRYLESIVSACPHTIYISLMS